MLIGEFPFQQNLNRGIYWVLLMPHSPKRPLFPNWGINLPHILGGRSQESKDKEESFIKTNREELLNLVNTSWWQQKMTPEEWEMKRHPNRGPSWIPTRLRNIRQKLWHEWYKIRYVDGKDIVMRANPDASYIHNEDHEDCIRCKRTKEEYIRDSMLDDLERGDGTRHFHSWYYGWCRFCSKEVENEMLSHRDKVLSRS